MLRLILFFVINFAALGIGGILIGNPATNEWYNALHKAPWTPPGWVFGFAWTSIMICFSVFCWKFVEQINSADRLLFYILFAVQFLLNVMWNPVFFRWHFVTAGFIVILLLTAFVIFFLFWGWRTSGWWSALMLPYAVWLIIASSLNGYILFNNKL